MPAAFMTAGARASVRPRSSSQTPEARPMTFTPLRPPRARPPIRINLYSDTQTRPTPAMREAMKRAEVGDEQHGNDPTVHALCDRVAALLGKEAAMFLPSGTMCNVVAILTHCRAGEEVIAHRDEPHPDQRGRGPRGLLGRADPGAAGRARAVHRRRRARRHPPAHALCAAAAAAGGGADRQHRRRHGLAAGAARTRWRRWRAARAGPRTWTVPA